MCNKLPYCATKIDPCIVSQVKMINENAVPKFRTWSSCCGHGKYKPTIICLVNEKTFMEWFSKKKIMKYDRSKRRKMIRLYKKDEEGVYHIPNVSSMIPKI